MNSLSKMRKNQLISKSDVSKLLLKLMPEELLDTILRCGLYFGAIFQIICIAAVVIIPENSSNNNSSGKDTDASEDELSDQNGPLESPKKPQVHHKTRKTEKKKRR